MKNMQLTKNKILNLLLSLCIVLRCLPMITVSSTDSQHVHSLASANSDCLVCDLAYKINSLPTAEEITNDNSGDKAGEAYDLIQEIDAIKFDLTDDQYYELEALVGKNIPRYFDAVYALQSLRGSIDLTIDKAIVLSNGEKISADDERLKDYSVSFEIEPVVGTSALSTNMLIETDLPDQNSAKTWVGPAMTYDLTYNTDSSRAIGLTNTYSLPAGTYKIRETNLNKPFVIDGKTYYTTSVTYKYNGQELSEGSTITLSAGDTNILDATNNWEGETGDAGESNNSTGSENGENDEEKTLVPDDNLREALRQALIDDNIITAEQKINADALAALTVLRAGSKNIKNLTGLEYCTSLQQLNLYRNHVVDIKPLENLTDLEYLELYENNVGDISALSKLTKMRILGLSYNQIYDIDALASLKSLEQLDFVGNHVIDVSALSSLTNLEFLACKGQYRSLNDAVLDGVNVTATAYVPRLKGISDSDVFRFENVTSDGIINEETGIVSWNNFLPNDELAYDFVVPIKVGSATTEFTGRISHRIGNTLRSYIRLLNTADENGIVWLLEDTGNDNKSWFGFKLGEVVSEDIDLSDKYFYVEWISPEEMLQHPEYANLDPEEKAKIQESRGKLFYAGIADVYGDKIDVEFSDEDPAKLYVKVGQDWQTQDLQSVFIKTDTDEKISISYDGTVTDPEGGEGYAVMNLTHFSPYFMYDAETSGVGDSPIQAPSGSGDSSSENDSEEKLEEDDSEELQDDYNNLESVLKDFFITGDSKTKIIAWSTVGLILTALGVLVFMRNYKKIK